MGSPSLTATVWVQWANLFNTWFWNLNCWDQVSAVAGDIDVDTPADLEGRRVAYIRGADAINLGTVL